MAKQLELFLLFGKISAMSFGGGYTVLPLFRQELVERRQWLNETELNDMYALAQCLPGLIMVNTAVLVVRPRFGVAGAIAAVLGVMTPPLIIVLLIASLLTNYAHLPLVAHALAGVRVSVAALVVWTAWRLIQTGVKGWPSILLFLLVFALVLLDIVNTVLVVIGAAALGIIWGFWQARRAKK